MAHPLHARPAVLLLLATLFGLAAAPATFASRGGTFSYGRDVEVAAGETALEDVVAVAGSVTVFGTAEHDVAAVAGSVRVDGEVKGDVFALGGSVRFGHSGLVGGDVICLGGTVRQADEARVGGRVIRMGSLGSVLGTAEGEAGHVGTGRFMSSFRWRVALLLGWLVAAIVVSLAFPSQAAYAAEELGRRPVVNGIVGLLGLAVLYVSLAVSLLLSLLIIGLPLLVLFLLGGLLLKVFGLVAVFQLTGRLVLERLSRTETNPLVLTAAGFALLGALRLLPWVGPWIWLVAGILGFGVSLSTKFGTGLPWFTGRRPRSAPETASR